MIATTLKQSEHLVELGIDIETADMYRVVNGLGFESEVEVIPASGARARKAYISLSDNAVMRTRGVPAWSAQALANIVREKHIGMMMIYGNHFSVTINLGTHNLVCEGESLVEALYETVVALNKLNQ